MTNATTFTAQKRTLLGKSVKKLRQAGKIPANIFGQGQTSESVEISAKDFGKLYTQVGDTGVVYLEVGGSAAKPVLIEEIQYHPISSQITHVAFKQVNLKQKIKAQVPVEITGEFKMPDAVVVLVQDEVEVEALPTDLPEKFVIDVSKFTEIGQSVTMAQLEYDHDLVKLMIGEEELNTPVVMVQEHKEFVEEVVPVATEAEGAVPAEGAAEAKPGETPAAADAGKKDAAAKTPDKK